MFTLAQATPIGEPSIAWGCIGLCSGQRIVDLVAGVTFLAAMMVLTRTWTRARAAKGHGSPGRVVARGLGAIALSMPFIGSSVNRICVTSAMGVRLQCRNQVLGFVLAQGVLLFAAGILVVGVGRDLRENPALAPLGPRRTR